MKKLQKFFKQNSFFNQTYFYTNRNLIEEYNIIYRYFNEIRKYNEYIKFSLGDSLDKFNYFWNTIDLDKKMQILQIPFSDSMFINTENVGEVDTNNPLEIDYVLDETKKELMFRNYNELLRNNKNFRLLVDNLNLGKKVVVTDFILSGKIFETLLILFINFDVNIDNLHFIFITFTDNIQEKMKYLIDTKYNTHFDFNNIKFIQITDHAVLNHYYTNSEDTNSRCVAKYPPRDWIINIDDSVYYDGTSPNFYNCNVHRLGYLLFVSCFYELFLKNNIDIYDNQELNTKLQQFFLSIIKKI